MEAVDLGQVYKIKIRHDNSMMSADWYLDQVEVVEEDTEEVFLFHCERWLSRKKEDRRIDRVFYVKVVLVPPENVKVVAICANLHRCVLFSSIRATKEFEKALTVKRIPP